MEKVASTLFGKTRLAVLTVLFEQPQRPRYLRELARLTGVSTGALQLELSRLTEANLLLRERDGNRVAYRPNTTSQIFEELSSIVHKTCGIPGLIRHALASHGGRISQALIYGSLAKGTSQSASDVDLLVVGNIPLKDLVQSLSQVEGDIGREINPRLFTEKEFKAKIAANDRFLAGILNGPTLPVIGETHDAG